MRGRGRRGWRGRGEGKGVGEGEGKGGELVQCLNLYTGPFWRKMKWIIF
jgi:hypothetical protein